MINAQTLTPEQRREAMPDFTRDFTSGFAAQFRGEIEYIRVEEAGHLFEWERK